MNKHVVILSILLSAPFAWSATADGVGAHGGGAVVCRDAQGAVTSVRLLDLAEAEANGLVIDRTETDEQKIRERVSQRLWGVQPSISNRPGDYTDWASDQFPDDLIRVANVPVGVSLTPPQDVYPDLSFDGCAIEGAANFNDAERLLRFNPRLKALMPAVDRVALDMHEALYHGLRRHRDARDSRLARKIIGYAFSTRDLGDAAHLLHADGWASSWRCLSKRTDAYLSINGGRSRVIFHKALGSEIFGEEYAESDQKQIAAIINQIGKPYASESAKRAAEDRGGSYDLSYIIGSRNDFNPRVVMTLSHDIYSSTVKSGALVSIDLDDGQQKETVSCIRDTAPYGGGEYPDNMELRPGAINCIRAFRSDDIDATVTGYSATLEARLAVNSSSYGAATLSNVRIQTFDIDGATKSHRYSEIPGDYMNGSKGQSFSSPASSKGIEIGLTSWPNHDHYGLSDVTIGGVSYQMICGPASRR